MKSSRKSSISNAEYIKEKALIQPIHGKMGILAKRDICKVAPKRKATLQIAL
jgi:hypothetical protein